MLRRALEVTGSQISFRDKVMVLDVRFTQDVNMNSVQRLWIVGMYC